MPAHLDIPIQRNEDYNRLLTISDNLGVPIDITGWSFDFDVRDKIDNSVLIEAGVAVIDDAPAGQVALRIDGGPGSALNSYGNPLHTYHLPFDLLAIDIDGERLALIRGDVILSRGVSQ